MNEGQPPPVMDKFQQLSKRPWQLRKTKQQQIHLQQGHDISYVKKERRTRR